MYFSEILSKTASYDDNEDVTGAICENDNQFINTHLRELVPVFHTKMTCIRGVLAGSRDTIIAGEMGLDIANVTALKHRESPEPPSSDDPENSVEDRPSDSTCRDAASADGASGYVIYSDKLCPNDRDACYELESHNQDLNGDDNHPRASQDKCQEDLTNGKDHLPMDDILDVLLSDDISDLSRYDDMSCVEVHRDISISGMRNICDRSVSSSRSLSRGVKRRLEVENTVSLEECKRPALFAVERQVIDVGK